MKGRQKRTLMSFYLGKRDDIPAFASLDYFVYGRHALFNFCLFSIPTVRPVRSSRGPLSFCQVNERGCCRSLMIRLLFGLWLVCSWNTVLTCNCCGGQRNCDNKFGWDICVYGTDPSSMDRVLCGFNVTTNCQIQYASFLSYGLLSVPLFEVQSLQMQPHLYFFFSRFPFNRPYIARALFEICLLFSQSFLSPYCFSTLFVSSRSPINVSSTWLASLFPVMSPCVDCSCQ